MERKTVLHDVKAISPLIATLLLIAITVVGGLIVYGVFFGMSGTMGTTLNIEVSSLDLVKTGITIAVSASIKNTGNKHITKVTVEISGDANTVVTLTIEDISPGQVKGATETRTVPSELNVTVGKTYPVKVEALAADDSTLSKVLTVACKS